MYAAGRFLAGAVRIRIVGLCKGEAKLVVGRDGMMWRFGEGNGGRGGGGEGGGGVQL